MFGILLEFDIVKGVEKFLYDLLIVIIGSEEKIEMVVNYNLVNFEEKFMCEVVYFYIIE